METKEETNHCSTTIVTTTVTPLKNMIYEKGNNDNRNLLPVTLTATAKATAVATTTRTRISMAEVMNERNIDLMKYDDKIDAERDKDYDNIDDIDGDDDDDEFDDDDEDDEDDEFDDDESDATDLLDDVEAASLLISSDEEAELEAQRIRFPLITKKKHHTLNVVKSAGSVRNNNAPAILAFSTATKETNGIASSVQANVLINNSLPKHNNNDKNDETNLTNKQVSTMKYLKIGTPVAAGTVPATIAAKSAEAKTKVEATTTTKTTIPGAGKVATTITTTKITAAMTTTTIAAVTTITALTATTAPAAITTTVTATATTANTGLTNRRSSQSCTSNIITITPMPEPNVTRLIGSIYTYSTEMSFVFHCEHCDIQYGDFNKFICHLKDTHKMLCTNEEHEKENSPSNIHQCSTIAAATTATTTTTTMTTATTTNINRNDLNVKKEPLMLVEQHISISTSCPRPATILCSINEPLEYCAKIYIINHRRLSLHCIQCDCKYNEIDLLQTHMRQQHRPFEKRKQNTHNIVNSCPIHIDYSSDIIVKKEVCLKTDVIQKSTIPIQQNTKNKEIISNSNEVLSKTIHTAISSNPSLAIATTKCDNLAESLEKETCSTPNIPQLVTNVIGTVDTPCTQNTIVLTSEIPIKEQKRLRGRPSKNRKKDNQKLNIPMEPKKLRQTLKRKVQQFVETDVVKNPKQLNRNEKIRGRNSKKSTSVSIIPIKQSKVTLKSPKMFDKNDKHLNEIVEEERKSSIALNSLNCINEMPSSETVANQTFIEMDSSKEINDLDINATAASKRYTCEQCDRSFAKYSRLMEHQRLHTGEKPFNCDQCGKHFRIKMRLNEHQLRHNKDKKYKCEMCSLALATRQDLTLHMRHHTGDRRYQCTTCPKAFVRSSDLKIHVRIHTGEKPYICDICNKSFRANQNLIVHKRSHMGDDSKAYKCEQCDKRFMRNIDRKVHMRTHTGEKPYKCEICLRGYSSRVHVRAHIQREHVAPNGIGSPPKSKKKPGPKPKILREELVKHKKLIEELKLQLTHKIKIDEKLDVDKLGQCSNLNISKQEIDNNYDIIPKINSPKSPNFESIASHGQHDQWKQTVKTVNSNILSPVILKRCIDKDQQHQQQHQQQQLQHKHSNKISNVETTCPNKNTTATYSTTVKSPISNATTATSKVVTQKSSLGIQQLSVTVSMQMGNVLDDNNKREKENAGCVRSNVKLTAAPSSGAVLSIDTKKDRKITSYFTIIGQKNEKC